MKGGGGSSYAVPNKKRWRGFVIAVLGLVLLSMLVPLVFLLGLHNGFHSVTGHGTEQRSSTSTGVRVYEKDEDNTGKSEDKLSTVVEDLLTKVGPTLPKDFVKSSVTEAESKSIDDPVNTAVSESQPISDNPKVRAADETTEYVQGTGENEKLCELKFGSYCLWRQQHRERMKDSMVKKMKDQLYVARAYYPSIAKLPALENLTHEMKQNIQEYERILSESASDSDLPSQVETKLQKMEATIIKAKAVPVDCNNVDKKFRQLVDLIEDEANFHMKQSAFLYQLAVQTTPKSLHCLSMRLTVEYFRSSPVDREQSDENYLNPELDHYVIFSNNILGSSVVINSTVTHSRAIGKQVFHVITNKQNFFAMKMWFFRNTYKEATVQVVNIEDLDLNGHDKTAFSHLSLPEEFRVSFIGFDKSSSTPQSRTEYVSVFSHSHYALPSIFQTLKKVMVLDDDIVVQRDLSALWSLDMEGKVIGAMQSCGVRLSDLKRYLGEGNYDGNSCLWMSGLNIVDLDKWREQDVTKKYQRFAQERLGNEEMSSEAITLRASLLAFQGLVHGLDNSWMLSGLGHNYGLESVVISKAAVLHFNGNMKPWLDLGIPHYKGYWRQFVDRENQFLSDCNVNP